jgi:hypothetical protein
MNPAATLAPQSTDAHAVLLALIVNCVLSREFPWYNHRFFPGVIKFFPWSDHREFPGFIIEIPWSISS